MNTSLDFPVADRAGLLGGAGGEVVAVASELGTLGQIFADEAVEVFVGAALSRRVRVGEVDRELLGGDIAVSSHFGAAVPG